MTDKYDDLFEKKWNAPDVKSLEEAHKNNLPSATDDDIEFLAALGTRQYRQKTTRNK
jgi:hypothetical protein